MELIKLNNTYGYKNFIDDSEKNYFLNWISDNKELFEKNLKGDNRKFLILKIIDIEVEEKIKNLKDKIIELEKINDWIDDHVYHNYIGINTNGGHIHIHTDKNVNNYIHTRWNIILQYPTDGGHSIYGDSINILEENMIWKCEAGLVPHGSTTIIGDTPRITLSLGFQIKKLKSFF
jgi:hypothetical protein